MSELVAVEKLEAAKMIVLNGQRLTDVPGVVLENEWCQQYLHSLYLKNNLICRVSEKINQLKSLTQIHMQLSPDPHSVHSVLATIPNTGCTIDRRSLENNKLEELPSSIKCLTELETLSVASNRLTHLPESLGELNKLRHLYASRNRFRSIPDSLWSAPSLSLVDFHDNLIEEIQPAIIHCQSLEMLFLMKNKLHCIPVQVSHLPLLKHLVVGSNLLESFILSVMSMTSLFQLSLTGNKQLTRIPVDLYLIHPIILDLAGTAEPQTKAVNPHLLCEIGPIPLLQELSARVLHKALEDNKELDPLLLWLPKQLAQILMLPLTLCDWLVPSGACHSCGQAFFLYYIQREGHGQEFLHEILGTDCRTIGDDLNNYQKQNIYFTASYCSVKCSIKCM